MPQQLINLFLSPPPPKPPKCPQLAQIRKNLKICRSTDASPKLINTLCKQSRKLSRARVKSIQINSNLTFNSLLAKNPPKAFKFIRNSKKGNSKNITSLTVGKIKYKGVRVKDGFFDSLSALKNPPLLPVLVIMIWIIKLFCG